MNLTNEIFFKYFILLHKIKIKLYEKNIFNHSGCVLFTPIY